MFYSFNKTWGGITILNYGHRSFLSILSLRSDCTEGSDTTEKADPKVLVDDVKAEWKLLWHERFEDKFRAEGIARQDYELLFVDRGTVIIATRAFKPLDFKEILYLHGMIDLERFVSPPPHVGGWRKFSRTVLNKKKRVRRWKKPTLNRRRGKNQQHKKGGRGWLHHPALLE